MKLAFPLELFRADFTEHLHLLQDCGVVEVPLYFMANDEPACEMSLGEKSVRMFEALNHHIDQIKKVGLKCQVLYLDFRHKPADVMADDINAQKWFDAVCAQCQQHGIKDVGFFPNNPAREQTDTEWDNNQLAGYRMMSDIAGRYHLRISVHLNMINGSRYSKAEDIDDLFLKVGEDNFGLLFCFGCIALAGLDLSDAIFNWRKRIFIVHLRDVEGYWGGNAVEAQFGTGRIKLAEAISALRRISYDGILHPEHFPVISSELSDDKSPLFTHAWDRKLLSTTWTLGFWRGMLSAG